MPKIGHVHLKVSNLKKAEEFYTKVFGLKVSERIANYLFLTYGKEHHDLALQEIENAKQPSEDMTGLYHFAVELENLKQLAKIYFKLKKLKIHFTPINHGISKTIYFADPDSNGIEVYVDTRQRHASELGDERARELNASSRSREQVELSHFTRTRSQLTKKWHGMSSFIKEEDFKKWLNQK